MPIEEFVKFVDDEVKLADEAAAKVARKVHTSKFFAKELPVRDELMAASVPTQVYASETENNA